MNKNIDISVVIPVFNSRACLADLLERIKRTLNAYRFEVILVDDGSKDGSWEQIIELKNHYPDQLRAVRLKKNYGQHNAIMCGFSLTKGNFVVTMDDDLQHPPEEIHKLIQKQKESAAEIIYGIPANKKHHAAKKMGSYFTRRTSKYFANNPKGEGSSFRLISKSIIDQINRNYSNNYAFIDEIIFWFTSDVAIVEVEHHERKIGKSGYTLTKLIGLYFDVFINYTANPLRFMIYVGILSSVITFIFGAKFIIRKLIVGAPLGYTSIIVSILFSTSIIMLCLGILGKYIFNLYQQQSGKPLYGIQKII